MSVELTRVQRRVHGRQVIINTREALRVVVGDVVGAVQGIAVAVHMGAVDIIVTRQSKLNQSIAVVVPVRHLQQAIGIICVEDVPAKVRCVLCAIQYSTFAPTHTETQ